MSRPGSSSDAAPKAKAAAKAKAAVHLAGVANASLADLVATLEESRVTDTSGDFAKMNQVKQQREQHRKEVARLNAETRAIARRRKRQLAKTEKASTADLLEALRSRMLRKRPAAEMVDQTDTVPPEDKVDEDEEPEP